MTTNREMLELAARAAGIGPVLCYETRRNCLRIGTREKYVLWQPCTDDGDALRLAVKLGLGISIPLVNKRTDVVSFSGPLLSIIEAHGDPYAATRLAIVRAAAEIGRRMLEAETKGESK